LLGAGACATGPDVDPGLLAEGERQFGRCYACHSLDPADAGLSGPHLAGIAGRPAGAVAGFDYSPAMDAAAQSGLTWTEAALERFIADPDSVVPGTSMSPTGMVRADQRAALIAYLKSRF
jgi:cytochrome c2